MVKRVGKRFLSIALVLVLVLTLLPAIEMSANAAEVTGLADSNIGLDGDEAWSASADSINGSVTGTPAGGCSSASSSSSTLTIKNNKSSAATLSFNYTVTLNGGSVTIGGTSVTENGSFRREIAAGGTIQVKITSAEGASTTSIAITNIKLLREGNAMVTFLPGEHGSYTVDGTAVTQQTQITKSSSESFALVATAASGYRFFAWEKGDGSKISFDANYSLQTDEDITLKPVFVPSTAPVFEVSGSYFTDLNDAANYATANNKPTIILASNGTLPVGNYEIPTGKTLLIPYNAGNVVITDSNLDDYSYYPALKVGSAYKVLTMASGANLTVKGSVSVASGVNKTSNGQGGDYGLIQMNAGSSIEVASGGKLYAFGYIKGNGTINLQSGANAYEDMFFADYPGQASNAAAIVGDGAFPMMKFTVRNVEVTMTIQHGATETVHGNVYGTTAGYHTFWIDLVSTANDAMFKNAGPVTKAYKNSRQILDVNGDLTINGISLNLGSASASTSQTSGIPIPFNYTINVNSGTTTCNENIIFCAGTITNVAQGAKIAINSGKNVYVLDASDDLMKPSTNDAKLDINGELIANGKFYTSTNKAQIISSQKTGKVTLASGAPADKTFQEKSSNKTAAAVPVTSAYLMNGDGSYTETKGSAASTVFTYCATHDMWEQGQIYTITFDANGGEGTMESQRICNSGANLNANTFTREGYAFTGWNTAADGSGTAYADEAEVTLSGNVTLYAQWKVKTFTVKWLNLDGTELKTMEDVPYGTTVSAFAYDGATPTMPEDEYRYTFTGWSADSAFITEDTYFVAQYDKQALEYTVHLYFHVDGIDDELGGTVTLAANKSMKLTATPTYKTGGVTYYFDHWEFGVDDNTKLVYPAMSVTIRPSQAGDFTAYAVYSTTEKTDFEPFVMIIRDKMVGTKLVKTLTYSLTDDFTLVPGSVGFTVENADGQVIGSAFSQNLKGKTGTYTVTVANATEAVKVIAHITYQDANGAEFTKTAQ